MTAEPSLRKEIFNGRGGDPLPLIRVSDYSSLEDFIRDFESAERRPVVEIGIAKTQGEQQIEDWLLENGQDALYQLPEEYTVTDYVGKYNQEPTSYKNFKTAKAWLRSVADRCAGVQSDIEKGLMIHLELAKSMTYRLEMNPISIPKYVGDNRQKTIFGSLLNIYSSIPSQQGTCVNLSLATKMLGDMVGVNISTKLATHHMDAFLHLSDSEVVTFQTEEDCHRVKFNLPITGFVARSKKGRKAVRQATTKLGYLPSTDFWLDIITPDSLDERINVISEQLLATRQKLPIRDAFALLKDCNTFAGYQRDPKLKQRHFSMVMGTAFIGNEERIALLVRAEGKKEYVFIASEGCFLSSYEREASQQSFGEAAKKMKETLKSVGFMPIGKDPDRQVRKSGEVFDRKPTYGGGTTK